MGSRSCLGSGLLTLIKQRPPDLQPSPDEFVLDAASSFYADQIHCPGVEGPDPGDT
jgi:hypothetical protein